jgi:primary-amine oxidase
VNQDVANAWGSPRGYRISPGAGSIHRSIARKSPFNAHSGHANQHVAVTRRKETELSSSAALNQNMAANPLASLLNPSAPERRISQD